MTPDDAKKEFQQYIAGYLDARLHVEWKLENGQWQPDLSKVTSNPSVAERLCQHYETVILPKISSE